ncbi:type I restriction enzyme S subunit [Frischella perrara]|uniref:Restriction endonuclease S subunits protein n=1 Tax=Frischella perrara TaxID=1267021 RepID=A0A0A7S9J9_FRIPE|nr:restriction endonuclease subunit S [Frischella perrara]AJA45981.1 Restriction endonuclease S subunits protein [Frischella perrara]PWV58540.1 type I restriction enzyme S subunit [Frischella perrara]
MSKTKKLVPKRRFKKFDLSWDVTNLGEISDIVRGASPRPIQDKKWFDSNSEIGWLRISDVTEQNGRIYHIKQRLSKAGQEKTRVLNEPHLLLSIAATVGKPVINYVKTGVHDGFLIFQNLKSDIEFMFQYLDMYGVKWKKYGQPGSQLNLNSDIVKNHNVELPHNEEQTQIGEFFKKLDTLIQTQQKKLDKTKTLKSAYLAEMFPKDDESKPKLRFKGMKDNWMHTKLKDVIERELKGKTKATMLGNKNIYLDANYLNGGEINYVNASKDVTLNDVLILWDGSLAGTVYHEFEGALGSTLKAYKPKESGQFLYQFLKKNQQNIFNNYRTPNIPHVIKTFTEEFRITIPHIKEQTKIGNFFKLLDQKIALEQRKLEKLKKIKQAYLNEMFV